MTDKPAPADELRTAAEQLRSLATDATEGPWMSEDPNVRWGDDHDGRLVGSGKILATFNSDYNGTLNADYAAAMHPRVGLALADWLDVAAEHCRGHYLCCDNGPCAETAKPALAVARAINGAQS